MTPHPPIDPHDDDEETLVDTPEPGPEQVIASWFQDAWTEPVEDIEDEITTRRPTIPPRIEPAPHEPTRIVWFSTARRRRI